MYKRLFMYFLAAMLLLTLTLPVSAADATVVATETISLTSGSTGETRQISWTAPEDGVLTVSMAAADPGWGFVVIFSDGSSILPVTGKDAASYEYEILNGDTYVVEVSAYDKAGWCTGDGEISYEITFTPAQVEQEVVMEEYAISDVLIYLGQNDLSMEDNAVTTIFEFTPEESGVYRFSADGADALVGYWGAGSFFLKDFTENKSTSLEYTITSVGQSAMIGISGVDSCVLTVEKISDYEDLGNVETIVYENTHVFGSYDIDKDTMVAIDVFDDAADTAVLGVDGFMHYGTADGPLMVVDLTSIGVNVYDASIYGQLTGYGTNADGEKVKYDYNTAMIEYYNQGLYPVTEELATMLYQVGTAKGWYVAGGFLYENQPADEAFAWMGICYYVEPVTVPTLNLVAPSLNFEDEIYYNVYYTASDMTDVVEMGLITFDSYLTQGTIDDALEVIPGYTASGSNFMSHTNGIPSMKLGDALYFRVYAKLSDGTYAYSPTAAYHAVAYAKDILANSTNTKMKALVVAMLNYGAAAQVHFDYKTDALVNSFLTDEQKALVNEYSSDMVDSIVQADSSKTGNFKAVSGGYSALAPNVVFEGAFSINFYFTPAKAMDGQLKLYYWKLDDYNAADVLTTENATGVVVMEATSTAGQYVGAVTEIAAKQIDQTVYVCGVYESNGVTYNTGVIAYSLAAYCLDRIAKGSETMKVFAAQTVVYGYYAQEYFANLT